MRETGIVDSGSPSVPDLSANPTGVNISKDSYDLSITLPLSINRDYAFQFRFIIANEDPNDTTERLGPYSANYIVTKSQILNNLPDLTTTPANVLIKPGYYSYAVSWDKPTFNGYVETIIQESSTTTFTDSSTIVWRGTSNQANIMTLDTNTRYIRIYHEDQWYHGKSKAYISGPIVPKEPIVVDTIPPSNASGLTVGTTGIDPNDKTGFAGYATVSWTASTDPTTKTYRLRWTPNATDPKFYEYAIVPAGTTSYKLTTLIPGVTYYVTISAEDEYNNRSTFLTETTALVPAPTDGSIANWSSYITAGSDKNFRFGSGLGNDPAKNGIDFKVGTGYTNNYWYASGNFRVGNDTNYMLFNGTDLSVTGNINAKGGNFSGNILMSTSGASVYSGTVNTSWDGTGSQLTGTGFILNAKGLGLNGTSGKIRLLADTGEIIANAGNLGGWQLSSSTLSNNNATLDSNGVITLGTGTNQVVLSSTDATYRLWIGNNNGTYGSFKVDKNGKLYASGAVFTSSSIDGYATTGDLTTTNTNVSTLSGNVSTLSGSISGISTKADNAYNKAVSAETAASNAATKAQQAQDTADLKVAAADVATAINNNTTTINGSKITTGTIELNSLKVVGDTNNGIAIDNNGIRGYSGNTQVFNLNTGGLVVRGNVYSTTGSIGGFDLSGGDLTANYSVAPRIRFGGKINIGWESGYPFNSGNVFNFIAGSDSGSTSKQFYINTASDVFRFAADSGSRAYAAEIRNTVRATTFRYISSITLDSSSKRFKENIVYAPQKYYERVLNVTPAFYTYKKDHPEVQPELYGTHSFGMLAEDLEEAGLGYFVERNMEGLPTSLLNMHELPLLLIPIIRDLKKRIEDLENGK